MRTLAFPEGPSCRIATPDTPGTAPLVLMLLPDGLDDDVAAWMEAAAQSHGCTLAALTGMDWNNDLTPWPAPGVFKKAKPFEGNAEDFLARLTGKYLPAIREAAGLDIAGLDRQSVAARTTLLGISLSGLFALWASFRTRVFGTIASISGSLWYDGFADWACAGTPLAARHFISLGDREKNSKDRRMATVQDCTERIVAALGNTGTTYLLEEDTTHFSPIVPRLDKALAAVLD